LVKLKQTQQARESQVQALGGGGDKRQRLNLCGKAKPKGQGHKSCYGLTGSKGEKKRTGPGRGRNVGPTDFPNAGKKDLKRRKIKYY